jgi:hypothetical protein
MIEERYREFLLGLGAAKTPHSGRDFLTHLAGTHDLLQSWGSPPDVCNAGLFHSIYGTWHFKHRAFPIERRDVIRDLIGEKGEFLAYCFCVIERPKVLLANARASEASLYDHCRECWFGVTDEVLENLREIEAANLIEQGADHALLRELCGTRIRRRAKFAIIEHLEAAVDLRAAVASTSGEGSG